MKWKYCRTEEWKLIISLHLVKKETDFRFENNPGMNVIALEMRTRKSWKYSLNEEKSVKREQNKRKRRGKRRRGEGEEKENKEEEEKKGRKSVE